MVHFLVLIALAAAPVPIVTFQFRGRQRIGLEFWRFRLFKASVTSSKLGAMTHPNLATHLVALA